MTWATRIGLAGLAGTIVLAGAVWPAAAQTLKVSVRSGNQPNLSNDLLTATESRVAAIYADAGVEMTFVHDGPADLFVFLVSPNNEEKMHQVADALGFAPYSEKARGRIAYVFQGRVDQIAQGYGAPRSVVLAAAMAHEIGHMLLPLNAHSKSGVMRATLTQPDLRDAVFGKLLFTPEQASLIRSRLMNAEQQTASR